MSVRPEMTEELSARVPIMVPSSIGGRLEASPTRLKAGISAMPVEKSRLPLSAALERAAAFDERECLLLYLDDTLEEVVEALDD